MKLYRSSIRIVFTCIQKILSLSKSEQSFTVYNLIKKYIVYAYREILNLLNQADQLLRVRVTERILLMSWVFGFCMGFYF